jgi:hypothetical protein
MASLRSRGGGRAARRRQYVGAVCLAALGLSWLTPPAQAARPVISLTWSPTSLTFSGVVVGGLDQQNIALINTGTKTVRKPDISVMGNDFFIGSDSCSAAVLRAGDSCLVTIVFAPSAGGVSMGAVSTVASKISFAANLTGTAATVIAPTAALASDPATAPEDPPPHTCIVTATEGVACWGQNEFGQLGDGTLDMRSSPVAVPGLTGAVSAVAVGDYHSCALTTAGAVQCWGRNDVGQLGIVPGAHSPVPVDVAGLSEGVVAISAEGSLTCALRADRTVTCWGANDVATQIDGLRYSVSYRAAGVPFVQ